MKGQKPREIAVRILQKRERGEDFIENIAEKELSAANLAGKAALKRIQDATKATQAKQQALVDAEIANQPLPSKFGKDVTLSDGTVIKAPPVSLAGGARIDPVNGTMTRSDGVIINLKTGYPVPKIDTTA